MRVDDAVRLRTGSSFADLLGPAATATGRVSHAERDDGSGILRIAVAYAELEAYTSLLPAGEFDLVGTIDVTTPAERASANTVLTTPTRTPVEAGSPPRLP